jgi:hypothetical protein
MHHDPIAHSYDFATEMALRGEVWVDESGLRLDREPAPEPSPEEQAEIDRFGIFNE